MPPAIDQFTAGSPWQDVCAPVLLRHRNLQATRLFCQHPVSPDLEGLPNLGDLPHLVLSFYLSIWGSRAVTSTDFRNRLTVPPNSNRIRLTKRFASPYGALCFHVFTGSDSPPGPSRLSLQVLSLLVSNQTSFTQIKRQSKIITCSVLMHKNKSLTWCNSPTVSSRINAK